MRVKFFQAILKCRKHFMNEAKQFHLSSKTMLKFSEDHIEMKKTVNKIIEKDINPFVEQWEKNQQFPEKHVIKKLGDAGLLGITRPLEYGGLELDYSYQVSFLEELGNINSAGVISAITAHTDMTQLILTRFGSKELKEEFLAPTISGDKLSCIGVSEIHGGSDVAAIKTTAVRKGDYLIINGGKMWTTNGPQADWMCLLANTSQGHPHRNKSLICLPLKLPGIKWRKIETMGYKASNLAQFFFENVKIPAKNIIGEEGLGFTYQMIQFQYERMAHCLPVITALSRVIQQTIDYCKEREAFGQPIIHNQIIHFTLAELQSELESLRSLAYRVADKIIQDEDVTMLVSMLKLKTGRLRREITDKCLQFWGGMGYTSDVLISRAYRDGRLSSLAAGTDEVMLSIIAKHMGILPRRKELMEKN